MRTGGRYWRPRVEQRLRRGFAWTAYLAMAALMAGCAHAGPTAGTDTGHLLGLNAALPELGVDVHLETMDAEGRRALFTRLAGMGVTWLRLGMPWHALQPDSSSVSATVLAQLDRVIADATENGMRVLFIGDQAPDWAGGGLATVSNPEAYGAFMGALARHLHGSGPDATGPAYEILNEPNGTAENGRAYASPGDYARAACSAYQAIKAGDPSATVVVGSLDVSDWESWLTQSFEAGLGGCFDALSAHPYSGPAVLSEIRALAMMHGRPEVPMWVTEFGPSTCSTGNVVESEVKGCVDEAGQAAELVTTLRDLGRNHPWVPVAMIHEAQDEPDAPGGDAERSFGLFGASRSGTDWTAKPAVAAIRDLYGQSDAIRESRK